MHQRRRFVGMRHGRVGWGVAALAAAGVAAALAPMSGASGATLAWVNKGNWSTPSACAPQGSIGTANSTDPAGFTPSWFSLPGAECEVQGVALTPSYVYWSNGTSNNWHATIYRAPRGATPVGEVLRDLAPGVTEVTGIALNSTHLFYAQAGAGIGRMALDGSLPQDLLVNSSGVNDGSIAADDQYVYWGTYSGTIARASVTTGVIDGTFSVPIASGWGAQGMARDGDWLYFVDGTSIKRASVLTGAIDPGYLWTSPSGYFVRSLAVAGGRVYAADVFAGNVIEGGATGTGTTNDTFITTGDPCYCLYSVAAIADAPVITSVAPARGPAAGGTVVTITGTGLGGSSDVRFGGTAAAAFTVESDTRITATTPAHAAGAADVSVTGPGGTSNAGTFTFEASPAAPPEVPAQEAGAPTQSGPDAPAVRSVRLRGGVALAVRAYVAEGGTLQAVGRLPGGALACRSSRVTLPAAGARTINCVLTPRAQAVRAHGAALVRLAVAFTTPAGQRSATTVRVRLPHSAPRVPVTG